MRILYSHHGTEGKDGWGRSFFMAKALAFLGHEVVFLTNKPEFSVILYEVKILKNVKVICFPDFLPRGIKSTGFGTVGLLYKLIYSAFHKFDLVIADCGHRPSGLPCRLNRLIYKSIYISEWWDYFGKEGYYSHKPFFFKLFYGWIEKWAEIDDKRKADGVIVLSSFMKERALNNHVKNVQIIPGGSLTDVLKMYPYNNNPDHKITFGYIGMDNEEVALMEPFFKVVGHSEFKNKILFVTYGNYLKKEIIEKYNLDGVIKEKGWIDYLSSAEELKEVDIFIHIIEDDITARAGWPNKLGDYLALGRPVMISPYGDLIEFVSEHPLGFIHVDFNSESIKSGISSIINGDYNLPLMGEFNRKLSESISWEKRAAQLVSFYFSLKTVK